MILFKKCLGFIFSSLIICFLVFIEKTQCAAKWEKSGMDYSYNILKGCTIKTKSGIWIPEAAYKNIEK